MKILVINASYITLLVCLINIDAFYPFPFFFLLSFCILRKYPVHANLKSSFIVARDKSGRKLTHGLLRERWRFKREILFLAGVIALADATFFCVLVVAFFTSAPRSNGTTKIENPLSLFFCTDAGEYLRSNPVSFSTRRKQAQLSLPIPRR